MPENLNELKNIIREMLGKNARRKVVELFSVDKIVEYTIKVYDVVVSKNTW